MMEKSDWIGSPRITKCSNATTKLYGDLVARSDTFFIFTASYIACFQVFQGVEPRSKNDVYTGKGIANDTNLIS